ncbi:MAG: hypothetical protein KGS48_12595 [Bacteroidetes bacterium]|nr:hypothetical protein [Bacteroidota bacterium]
MMRPLFVFLLATLPTLCCSAQQATRELRRPNGKIILLLDSTSAAKRVCFDPRDNFFQLINATDISIQTKTPRKDNQPRIDLVQEYQSFLKKDARSFNAQELRFTVKVIEDIYHQIEAFNPDLLPDTLFLIKTKSKYYGDGVYYTRDKCIIIPANELETGAAAPFTTTMYHELFHVFSRINPKKHAQLYQRIGYTSIGLKSLELPTALADRVLLNPDGVDYAQKIDIKISDTATISAIPIIYSKYPGFKPGVSEFFSYLQFNLFQIKPGKAGKFQVLVGNDGFSSPLNIEKLGDFFKQIGRNTNYIIHPDEVLADNFAFLMEIKAGTKNQDTFDEEGQKLLNDIESILLEK